MHRTNRATRRASGFTLLEMMLVVVIIGILATLVVVNITGQGDEAKRAATVASISQVKAALQQYYNKYNNYPANLSALATGTPALLTKVPKDGWGRDLVYYSPGQEQNKPFSLYSAGADTQTGTNDDVNVWTMDERQPEGG